jgi:GT2 family glycosyltransferase
MADVGAAWRRATRRTGRLARWKRREPDGSDARRRAPFAVSVVVNTLNRRDALERTLVALRQQTYQRFEVIVVNGPSVDGTDEMLRAYQDRARVVECTAAALGPSRNVGIGSAAGDIVAFTDDDAIPRANWLESLVARYDDPIVAAVGGPVFDVPLGQVEWSLCTCSRLGVPNTDSEGPVDRYLGVGADPLAYLPGCNMSFRRHVLEEIGGFNSLLTATYDDVEACSRVIDKGYRIHVLKDALVDHYRAPNAVRDNQHAIRDPYPILYCRAIFASQTYQPARRADEVLESIRGAEQELVNLGSHYLSEGRLSPKERDAFVDRARRGTADGLRAGSGARPIVSLGPPARSAFHSYR